MKYLSPAFFCFTVWGLSGCGLKYVSHQELLQKHVGRNVEDVIGAFGAPRNSTPLPSGNTVYLFVTETVEQEQTSHIVRERYSYASHRHDYSGRPGEAVSIYQQVRKACRISATTNSEGRILAIHSQGDGCKGEFIRD